MFKERELKEEIVGKVFSTNKSGDCVVTKYVGCNEVYVKFLDTGFERVTDTNSLRKASVKDTSLTKTVKKYIVGKENIVGKVFENSKGEQYEVLEKLSTTRFKVKFIDSGYETEINKINIEIGSIKDNSAVEEFNSLLGYQIQDEKFGVVTVRSYSDRLGEKVLVCENEDESLRFILTKEQLLLGDLSSFGIPPVILEKPLDFKVDNGGMVLHNGVEFDVVDFITLNVFFYLDNDVLYHRLIRKDSIDQNILKHKTGLAGKVAGHYPQNNSDMGHISILGVPFHVESVKTVLRGEIKSCSRRKFKASDIEAEGVHREYTIWSGMRCRCNKGYAKLSEDFENFWDWLDWAKQQKGFMCEDEKGNIYQMETDLFSTGEKVYSKESVVFVPYAINQMCKPTKKGNLPKGVQYLKGRWKEYRAYGVEFGKQVHLGYYYTLKEALRVAKKQREIYVDKLKSLYGDTVESKVFEVLLEDRWSE